MGYNSNELSLIKFCVYNFWATLINTRPFQPISTLLLKLVESTIKAEEKPNKEMLKRIDYIYNHTSERIDAHLSVVELIVFKNLDKGVNKEVDIGEKTFYLSELYYILDGITKELSLMIIEVAKKYSIDMPLINIGNQGNFKVNTE